MCCVNYCHFSAHLPLAALLAAFLGKLFCCDNYCFFSAASLPALALLADFLTNAAHSLGHR